MVATKRWSPKQVAATPGSHRRQGGGEPRKIVQEIHPPSGDGGYEEVWRFTKSGYPRSSTIWRWWPRRVPLRRAVGLPVVSGPFSMIFRSKGSASEFTISPVRLFTECIKLDLKWSTIHLGSPSPFLPPQRLPALQSRVEARANDECSSASDLEWPEMNPPT